MKIIIIFTILITTSLPAFADVYSWEDKDGMHFVDDPGKVPAKYRNQIKSDTDAERISVNNEFKGYTKNGITTDKGWKTQFDIIKSQERLQREDCKRKYKDPNSLRVCFNNLLNWYKAEISKIPPHILKEYANSENL